MQFNNAEEAVGQMFNILMDAESPTRLHLDGDSDVALIVNNLGGTSIMEQNVMIGEAIKHLGNYYNRSYSYLNSQCAVSNYLNE